MQILNSQPTPNKWASALGNSLNDLLSGLVERKTEEMAYQKGIKRAKEPLVPLFGDEGANVIAQLPPELQKLAFQNPDLIRQIFSQQNNQQASQQQQQPQSPMMQGMNQLNHQPTREQQIEEMARNAGITRDQIANTLNPLGKKPTLSIPKQIQQAQQSQNIQQPPQELKDKAQLIADAFTSPQEKRERRKIELAEKKIAQAEEHFQKKQEAKEKAEAYKSTAKYREKIFEEAQAAKAQRDDLNRQEELESEGKLDTPGYTEFLKRSGLDIPALMNPGSEEFNKISNNYLRDAKTYFGGKVSNNEMEQFLKTVPSLSQSPEGRKRVIANLKKLANAKLAYADTVIDIIKENKGVPPFDIAEQVYERIDKKLDKLAEKFREDVSKPVPQGQNRLITALQTSLGSIIGTPGKILGGASKAIPTILEAI